MDLPNAAPTKPKVTPQVTSMIGTFQVQSATLDQPCDLEVHTRVDEMVEIPVGVFE